MSMEIVNAYSGYSTNSYDSMIKKNTSAKNDKTADSVEEYYEKLCKKFPQISFNTSGGVLSCSSNKVVVNLSYDCLKKMANDPEFAKEVEWNLSGEVTANSMVYSCAKRDGVELGGRTVTYDANGNRQSSCGGMRTANVTKKSFMTLHTEKQQNRRIEKKRKEKKRLEELRKNKKESKEYLKELHKKKEARQEYMDEKLKMSNLTVTTYAQAEYEHADLLSTIDRKV